MKSRVRLVSLAVVVVLLATTAFTVHSKDSTPADRHTAPLVSK